MIRVATPDDIPALVDLGRQMCAESPRWSRLVVSDERLATSLKNLIEHEDGFVCVACRGTEVVGAVVAVAEPHWASEDVVAHELALFVTPTARGFTHAARLITELVAWGASKGAKFLQAGTSTDVHTDLTVRLYEKLGFECGCIGLEYVYGPLRSGS